MIRTLLLFSRTHSTIKNNTLNTSIFWTVISHRKEDYVYGHEWFLFLIFLHYNVSNQLMSAFQYIRSKNRILQGWVCFSLFLLISQWIREKLAWISSKQYLVFQDLRNASSLFACTMALSFFGEHVWNFKSKQWACKMVAVVACSFYKMAAMIGMEIK